METLAVKRGKIVKKILLVLLLLSVAKSSYAEGPQIFGGYRPITQATNIERNVLFGFQYAWLKTPDKDWQFLSPGFCDSWSLQLIGKRLVKLNRQKWLNPPDLYMGVHLTGKKGVGVSLSFGW